MENFILHIFRSLTGICTCLLYIKNVRLGKALLLKAASGWVSSVEQRKGSELGLSFLQRSGKKYFKGFGTSYVVNVPQRMGLKLFEAVIVGRIRAGICVKPGLEAADPAWNMWEHLSLLPVPLSVQFSSIRVAAAAPGSSWGALPALPQGSGSRAGPSHSIPLFDCLPHGLSSQHSVFFSSNLISVQIAQTSNDNF